MGALEMKPALNLLIDYLEVCNVAIEKHRDSLVHKTVIAAWDMIFGGRDVGIQICDDQDRVQTSETIRFVNGAFVPVAEPQTEPAFRLKVNRSYLEDVLAHRDEYERHPEKLDWDWLKSRLGMDAHHKHDEANMRPPEPERYAPPEKGANMRPKSGRSTDV